MTFFDRERRRLVMLGDPATASFWDSHWGRSSNENSYPTTPPKRNLIVDFTRRFLPGGGFVLEGGSGTAEASWRLHQAGYTPIALDYAPRTVRMVRRAAPQLNPVLGSVADLPLGDGSIDGYWSLGVIEHYYEGYEPIACEMARVLRPGGVLFLTFPHMSRLRGMKAALGRYPDWMAKEALKARFYQFALDHDNVIKTLESVGFTLRAARRLQGATGIEQECPLMARILRLTVPLGRGGRLIRSTVDKGLAWFTSHLMLLVMDRT